MVMHSPKSLKIFACLMDKKCTFGWLMKPIPSSNSWHNLILCMASASSQSQRHCKICGDLHHRSRDCPAILTDEEFEAQTVRSMSAISETSRTHKTRPPAVAAASKQLPGARAKARGMAPMAAMEPWQKVEAEALEIPLTPEHYFLEPDAKTNLEVTPEEINMVLKRRSRNQASVQKRKESRALTGWRADYPSLSHFWSEEVPFNMVGAMKSRTVTFMWKKLLWQLRAKEAVTQMIPGARWKKNPRWLAMLLGKEVATLFGHYGAMRQKMNSAEALTYMWVLRSSWRCRWCLDGRRSPRAWTLTLQSIVVPNEESHRNWSKESPLVWRIWPWRTSCWGIRPPTPFWRSLQVRRGWLWQRHLLQSGRPTNQWTRSSRRSTIWLSLLIRTSCYCSLTRSSRTWWWSHLPVDLGALGNICELILRVSTQNAESMSRCGSLPERCGTSRRRVVD